MILVLFYQPKRTVYRLVGPRHLRYLREHPTGTYTTLLTSGRLNACLADVDKQVQERMERLTEQMKRAQGITEQLKAENGFGMDTKNEYHTSICKGNCRKENHFCIGTERRQGEISVAY